MRTIYLSFLGALLLIGGVWIGTTYQSNAMVSYPNEQLQKLEEDLCSPEGLMKLIPQLKNANGQFEIPDPTVDLEKYLFVRQTLINVIEMALSRANVMADPYSFAMSNHSPLKMPVEWNATEVGFSTDAQTTPDFSGGGYGYTGKSFMNGVTPVRGTNNSFYTVPGSVVYMSLMPTALSCVNRIMETSGLNGGTMMASSYVLGGKDGYAYLIVNGCQNTARTITIGNQQVLAPAASSYLGMQWVKKAE